MSNDYLPGERVRILTVCTGNICRSPYVQVLLRSGLQSIRPGIFEVTSAGTHALVGSGVDKGTAQLLYAHGLTHDDVIARLLTPEILSAQDLVVGMAKSHVAFAVGSAPSIHRRTTTLIALSRDLERVAERYEWTEIMAEAGADGVLKRWRLLPDVLHAYARRRWRRTVDIDDPYRQGDLAFDRMARQVVPAVKTIIDWEAQFSD